MQTLLRILPKLTVMACAAVALFLLNFLTACSSEPVPYKTHVVLIDINEPATYTWSDLDDPNMGWVTLANGKGNYSFKIIGKKIVLESGNPIQSAKFLKGTMDTEGEELHIISKKSIEREVSDNGIFKITFP